jgi:predicted GNAT family acetyltransferase
VSEASLRRSLEADQYEWVVDERVVAVLGFEERGSSIVLLHTATEPAARGQGHATRLVGAVLQDVADRGLVPSVRCPFIRAYLKQHPAPAASAPTD